MTWLTRRLALAGGILLAPAAGSATDPPPECGPRTRCAALRSLCQLPPPAPPLGFYVSQWYDAQIAKAEFQKQFVQLHEWYLGGSTLGPAGRRHLDRLARGLLDGADKVFVEPGDDDKLNETRRVALAEQLRKYGVRDADARVVLAYPLGEGLYGDDAVRIYPRLFLGRGGGSGGLGGSGFGISGGLGGLGGMGGIGTGFGGSRGY